MPVKPATISDLFSPMSSIKTCMDSHGTAIEENLASINVSVLGCASNLNANNKLIKDATKTISKAVIDSLKELSDAVNKQNITNTASTVGIASSISTAINESIGNVMNGMIGIGQQLSEVIKYVKQIEQHVDPVKSMAYQVKNKLKSSLNPFNTDSTSKQKEIKAPDVSGGSGVGELAKALADVAKTMSDISFKDAILVKPKTKLIIGGILEVLDGYKPQLNEKNIKSYSKSAKELNIIAKSINGVSKDFAGALVYIPFAMIGAKMSKKLIRIVLQSVSQLGETENLKKAETASISLAKISESVLRFNAAMALNAILVLPATIGFAASSLLIIGALKLFDWLGGKTTTENVRSASINIDLMSKSILWFSLSLLASTMITKFLLGGFTGDTRGINVISLVSTVGVFALMFGTYYIFGKLGSRFGKESVIEGSKTISMMGLAIMSFSLAFLTSYMITKLIIGDTLSDGKFDWKDITSLAGIAPIFALMMGGYYLFKKLGSPKNSKDVLNAGLSIVMMSLGLIVFASSFYVVHQITKSIIGNWDGEKDPAALVMDVAIFGMMFLGMYLYKSIGNNMGSIAKGTLGVSLMSIGLIVFGLGVGLYHNTIKDVTWEQFGMMTAFIGAFGLEFGLIGIPAVAGFVALGAATMLVVSASLVVFGMALTKYVEPIKSYDAKQLKNLTGLISAVGFSFAKVGIPIIAGAIFAGGAAIMAASGALSVLGKALDNWKDINISDEKLDLICKSVDRIKLAFQGMPKGEESALKRFGKGILGAVSAPFDIVQIKASAIALGIVGDSLKHLAKGLREWQYSGIEDATLTSVVKAVSIIKDVFGSIGSRKNGTKSSLLKKLIGLDLSEFEQTDVERGARSVKRMGSALTSIAKGLVNYKETIGAKFNDEKFMTEFATSVANVVTTLSTAFSSIVADKDSLKTMGSSKASTFIGRMWQDLTINTYGERTQVEAGIKAVKDLGKTIKDIATGMKEFKDIVPNEKSSFITDVAAGISALLQGIQEPLIAFGTTDETFTASTMKAAQTSKQYGLALSSIHEISAQTTSFSKKKTDVAAAMEHVGQIGDLVKGLAEGAKIMADPKMTKDIGKAGLFNEDFTVGDDASGAVGNIQKLVCSQLAIFLELGKKIQEVGLFDDIQDEIVNQDSMFKRTKKITVNKGKKSYLAIAVESASGIGSVIKTLAEGYKTMNDTFPSDKSMTEGTMRVAKSISSVMTAFSSIGMAMSLDYGTSIDLVPASLGNPEMTKAYGKIGGLNTLIIDGEDNPFELASKSMKTVTGTIANCVKELTESNFIKNSAKTGKSFVSFAESMAKGMNTLSGAKTNIRHSTDFVNALSNAVKNKAFDNVSSNTEKIAKAINSIKHDTFEPYARMIDAFSKMTEKHSDFVKMQDELYKLLEKIIDKINETNATKTQVLPYDTKSVNNAQTVQVSKQPQQPQQSQPLVAKLNTSSVTLDYDDFLIKFEDLLRRYADK